MTDRESKLLEFRRLITDHTPENGVHQTDIHHLMIFRETQSQGRIPWVYEPAVIMAAQGRKNVYLDGQRYEYSAGNFLALFMPMAIECELVDVSEEKPMLGVGIRLDRHRLAKLLLRIDSVDQSVIKPEAISSSGIFSAPINDHLLDAVIRLLKTLANPAEATVLGNSIIDEIYYRVLNDEQGGSLKILLRHQGQIQQIARAVEYLHENLDKNVSVNDLASIVNMSGSGFHKKFKEVMHISPLQYAKLIKLNYAKTYITEGRSVSEAGYLVGYNSPAQFSREYKRHFGMSPSYQVVQ